MAEMPTDLLVELRDIFNDRFDSEGLESLALMLGVDYENLPGRTRKMKAQNLALHLWRHDAVGDLAAIGPAERDDIEWAAILQQHGIAVAGIVAEDADQKDDEAADGRVSHTDLQTLIPIVARRPIFLTPDGRQAMLSLAGVDTFTDVDVNGSALTVATILLDQLNRYGTTEDGDSALGRLLVYVAGDPTLPPDELSVVESVLVDYALRD